MIRSLVAVLLFFVVGASTARADSLDELLEEAIAAYAAGLDGEARDERLEGFRRAELLFSEAAARGADGAPLYVNVGNAALQAEHLGPAVLAYRKALRREPGNVQVAQNLEHARAQLPAWVPTPTEGGAFDSFFFWQRSIPAAQRSLLAALCFGLASLFAALAIVRGSVGFRNAALVPGLAWGVLILSLVSDPARDAGPEGVVIAQDAVARAADSGNAPLRFADPLPGGTELRILEDRGLWLQIALHNGRTAWVSASSVGRIDSAPNAKD